MISLAERAAAMRLGTRVPERPDRLPRAMVAMVPHGTGMLRAIAGASARYPEAIAVASPRGTLTYRQLWRNSGSLASAILAEGVGPGQRIGLLARNDAFFVVAMIAGARAGVHVVLLNTALAGPQLADVVDAEGVTLILHDTELDALAGHCRDVLRWSADDAAVKSLAHDRPPRIPAVAGELIVLTSGTTGTPKGARRGTAGRRSAGAARAFAAALPWGVRRTVVLSAPAFHAWGLSGLILGLSLSCTIVIRPEFDASATLGDIGRHRADLVVAVPVMLQRLVALPPEVWVEHDPTSVQGVLSSGSALAGPVARGILDRMGPVLYNVYGSTEVAASTIARPQDLIRDPMTAGRPAPGVRVAVLDDDGRRVPRGATGAVYVGSSMSFGGYTNGDIRESVRGMMATGDLGHWDDRGCLSIDGRADDMIVSGGENVYPIEVEELLLSHAAIAEAAVAGRPDEDFGQALVAWVVPRPGCQIDPEDLRLHVRTELAAFKVPRRIEVLEELPRNAAGKVLRKQLG